MPDTGLSVLDKHPAKGQGGCMPDIPVSPADCQDMSQVRAGVDAIDRELVELLERRFAYMRAAARIKEDRATVRDETRKASVIASARTDAEARGLPGHVIEEIWERLVEGSIAYEFDEWDRLRD